jgi:hypothetical protein
MLRESLVWIDTRRGLLLRDQAKVRYLGGAAEVYDALIAVHLDRARDQPEAWKDVLETAEQARGTALRDMMSRRERRQYAPPPPLAD